MEEKDSKVTEAPAAVEELLAVEADLHEIILEELEVVSVDESGPKEILSTEEVEKLKKESLTVFVDESGSITKTSVSNNRYFIIALLFTRDSDRLKRHYRKGISALIKKKALNIRKY